MSKSSIPRAFFDIIYILMLAKTWVNALRPRTRSQTIAPHSAQIALRRIRDPTRSRWLDIEYQGLTLMFVKKILVWLQYLLCFGDIQATWRAWPQRQDT